MGLRGSDPKGVWAKGRELGPRPRGARDRGERQLDHAFRDETRERREKQKMFQVDIAERVKK